MAAIVQRRVIGHKGCWCAVLMDVLERLESYTQKPLQTKSIVDMTLVREDIMDASMAAGKGRSGGGTKNKSSKDAVCLDRGGKGVGAMAGPYKGKSQSASVPTKGGREKDKAGGRRRIRGDGRRDGAVIEKGGARRSRADEQRAIANREDDDSKHNGDDTEDRTHSGDSEGEFSADDDEGTDDSGESAGVNKKPLAQRSTAGGTSSSAGTKTTSKRNIADLQSQQGYSAHHDRQMDTMKEPKQQRQKRATLPTSDGLPSMSDMDEKNEHRSRHETGRGVDELRNKLFHGDSDGDGTTE